MIKYLIISLVFYSFTINPQQKNTAQEIDNWLATTAMLYAQGKTDEYIKENKAIIEASKKIHYSKGIATGNVRLAAAYSSNKEFKKSMACLDIAEKEEYTSTDYELQTIILRDLGRIYYNIGLFDEALKNFRKMKATAAKIKDKETRNFSINASENNMASTHTELHQPDSAAIYYKRVYKSLAGFKNKNEKQNALLNIVTINIAQDKLNQAQPDSAMYYLKMYDSFDNNGKNEFSSYMANELMGKIYFAKKQYPLSIDYYKKAIQLTKKAKYTTELKDLYYLAYNAYDRMGDQNMAKEYLKKYTFLNDSISKIEKSNIDAPVKKLIEEKEKPLESKNKFLLYSSIIAGLIAFIIIKYKHKKEKGKIIDIKEQETNELKQKLNTAFDEVVELAKTNDPVFLTRFQEVYPHIIKKLLQINPQLQASELKFCALLFLNFSAKDIAQYTFVQPQSIQTRKNRLRKKLNIPSEIDIYLWIKNLG